MRYEGTMVIVKDILRSKKFYTDILGLTIDIELDRHIIFKEGFFLLQENDFVLFAEIDSKSVHYNSFSFELVFETDKIESLAHRLTLVSGLRWIHGIKEHPWGRRAIRFFDPDGHVIEVGESMRLVVKRFLRQGMTIEQAAARSEFPISFVVSCKAELEKENVDEVL